MKKELPSMTDRELDELFRQVNENPEISFQSGDWEKMKTQLDHVSPNRRIKDPGHGYNQWLVGIIALIIFLGAGLWWSYWKEGQNEIEPVATEIAHPDLNQKDNSEQINSSISNSINGQNGDSANFEPETNGGLSSAVKSQLGLGRLVNIADDGEGIQSNEDANILGRSISQEQRPEEYITGLLSNGKSSMETMSIGSAALLHGEIINFGEPVWVSTKRKDLRQGSRFSLAILFAPDVTALSLKEIEGVGNSVGLNLEYYIKPNLSINTGILYAFKTYQGGKGSYPGYQPAPSGIQGNCWILDVPLNMRYYFFERPLSRWFISGGISTYLMLREKYGLEYYSYGKNYKKNLDLRNQNQHYFGIGNLSVGYERLLSDKFSLQIEPYVKVPINGIGEGKINLKSAGALIGLKYNW